MAKSPAVSVERARNGSPTLIVDGRYVHSRHAPEREATRAMSPIARREPPAVVMLGLGLGYHPDALLAGTELTRIVVFEPSDDLLEAARTHGPKSIRESNSRLFIAATIDALTAALPEFAAEGFEIFELPGRTTSEAAFTTARSIVRSFADRLDINRNTLSRFGRLWVRNLCRNLEQLVDGRGVNELAGSFTGVPCLLLAAGPTLDQILPILPQLAARTLVVAVDTAIAPALAAGVEPDIAVVVDPQYWNARHLDRVTTSRTLLVTEASAHPRVFRSFADRPFFCSSVFPLGRAFEEVRGTFGALGAGGSVSTAGWDLARLAGCNAVFTAGLDLGFPDGRTHCRSSFFEHLALILGSRLSPAEDTVFRYTWSASPFPVPANDGTSLLSDRRMAVYRAWFTSQLRSANAPRTASITLGGAEIDGSATTTVEEILRLPVCREEVAGRVDRLRAEVPTACEDHIRERLVGVTRQLHRSMLDLAAIAKQASAVVRRLQDDSRAGSAVDFSELEPLDARIAQHPGAAIGSFLVQNAINRIRGGYGSATVADQLDASAGIYDGLAEAAEFHARELGAVASRFVGTSTGE